MQTILGVIFFHRTNVFHFVVCLSCLCCSFVPSLFEFFLKHFLPTWVCLKIGQPQIPWFKAYAVPMKLFFWRVHPSFYMTKAYLNCQGADGGDWQCSGIPYPPCHQTCNGLLETSLLSSMIFPLKCHDMSI